MKKKVFVMMYGFPDEVRIGGVFSTRKAAKAVLRFGDEEGTVVECELDPPPPEGPAGCSLHFVQYDIQSPEYTGHRVPAFEPCEGVNEVVSDEGHQYSIILWARDQEDAYQRAAQHFIPFGKKQGVHVQLPMPELPGIPGLGGSTWGLS